MPRHGAIQILDRCHAKQQLNDVANAIYGKNSPVAEQWASERKDELDELRLDDLLAALGQHADTCKEAKTCVGYVKNNCNRMRYVEFEAMGLCTISNIVESGCKVIFTTRFKHSAMHWSVAGAKKMLAIRCCKRSGRFEEFFERRSPKLTRLRSNRITRPGLRALVCKSQTREVLSSQPQAGRLVAFREHSRVNSGECRSL